VFRDPPGHLGAVRRPGGCQVGGCGAATGDVVGNSSFVDLTSGEGDQRASWFATARKWPCPRTDTDSNLVFCPFRRLPFPRTSFVWIAPTHGGQAAKAVVGSVCLQFMTRRIRLDGNRRK
jgi:hypothetical protein